MVAIQTRYHGMHVVRASKTLYVATSGSDTGRGTAADPYLTFTRARDEVADWWWDTLSKTITIQAANGSFPISSAIDLSHPCGRTMYFTGENTYAKTMSSVQSSSGSTGNWSVIINLNSVADITTADYALITAASGGTLPKYIEGCHAITNVDGGNVRITIASKHRAATSPSGAVAAAVVIVPTNITATGCAGFIPRGGMSLGLLSKIALVGDGTAGKFAIDVSYANARAILGESVGISGWNQGLAAYDGGVIQATPVVCVSGCAIGIASLKSSSISLTSPVISGCSTAGAYSANHGSIAINGSTLTGNAIGSQALNKAFLGMSSSNVNGNTTGASASEFGYIKAASLTLANNGTDLNPVANTVSSTYGYISTT